MFQGKGRVTSAASRLRGPAKFNCHLCNDGSCQRCETRRHAQELILHGLPANHVFTNVEFDALLNEPIEQQAEAEITGRCSHGCCPELLIKNDSGAYVCKLTRSVCHAQNLSSVVGAYSRINAKPKQ